jgi:hypothetical protein
MTLKMEATGYGKMVAPIYENTPRLFLESYNICSYCKDNLHYVGCEIHTTVAVKNFVLWDIRLQNPVKSIVF